MGRKKRKRRRRALRRVVDFVIETAAGYIAMALRGVTHPTDDNDEPEPDKQRTRTRAKQQN